MAPTVGVIKSLRETSSPPRCLLEQTVTGCLSEADADFQKKEKKEEGYSVNSEARLHGPECFPQLFAFKSEYQ